MVAGYLLFLALGVPTMSQATTRDTDGPSKMIAKEIKNGVTPAEYPRPIKIFLAGDVMTGRGIDQILPHPGDPVIYESYMKDARGYVKIAEEVNGPIGYPVSYSYIWGDALKEFSQEAPDIRIINLETSVTRSDDYWKSKGINYRMHPGNIYSFTAAGIDVCSLANNHVMDWGYSGLLETLETIKQADIKIAGAGRDLFQARAPAMTEIPGKGRVIVFALGHGSSGIPSSWRATENRPGINLVRDLNTESLREIRDQIRTVKRKNDIIVVSIHWGSNWGYNIPRKHRNFAHGLIDEAGVDIIHGHSSHHVKAIEVYRHKLILYGCGDFLNDYEGISGHEEFRGDLALMYFATVDPTTGKLLALHMTPTRTRRFQITRASRNDAVWLTDTLNKEGISFGVQIKLTKDNRLRLKWK